MKAKFLEHSAVLTLKFGGQINGDITQSAVSEEKKSKIIQSNFKNIFIGFKMHVQITLH